MTLSALFVYLLTMLGVTQEPESRHADPTRDAASSARCAGEDAAYDRLNMPRQISNGF